MSIRSVAAGLVVCSIGVFLIGLYASPEVAVLGLLFLVSGAVAFLSQRRGIALVSPHPAVVAGLVFGVLLHVYEQLLKSSGFSLGWLLWALLPYGLCLVTSLLPSTRVPTIGGVVIALLFDLLVHYEVFVSPSSSTAALAMIFAPIWSSLVFSPLAIFLVWATLRRKQRATPSAP